LRWKEASFRLHSLRKNHYQSLQKIDSNRNSVYPFVAIPVVVSSVYELFPAVIISIPEIISLCSAVVPDPKFPSLCVFLCSLVAKNRSEAQRS
jgi:hypothetical protein